MPSSVPIPVKLVPDRALLNCDFETYRLSHDALPRYEIHLDQKTGVQRSKVVENDDFSLQFLSLQRMHNHLVGDVWVGNAVAYFVDSGFRVVCCSEADMRKGIPEVLKCRAVLPKSHHPEKLRYHCTLAFPSRELAVVAGGSTCLWLYDTGKRTRDNESGDQWELLEEFDFKDFVQEGFMLKDAKYAKFGNEEIVSCLLSHVDKNQSDGEGTSIMPEFDPSSFVTLVDWVLVSRHSPQGAWEVTRRRRFGGKHALLLAAIDEIEKDSAALVLASEGSEFRLLFDSECGVVGKKADEDEAMETNGTKEEAVLYEWNQTGDSVTVTMKLNHGVRKEDVTVSIEPRRIHVEAAVSKPEAPDGDSAPLKIGFAGSLASVVKPDESTWTLTDQKTWTQLEIVLSKAGAPGDAGVWKELIEKCTRGRETVDPAVAAEIHERLAHLTSETLVESTEQGLSLGMNQLEECDGLPPESSTLVRFVCGPKGECKVSHKASLSAHQWLFSAHLSPGRLPVACLRHDVDAVVWEFGPSSDSPSDSWSSHHLATFDAFGYVLASKENRKYVVTPPDLSYAAACDSKTHCYVYKGNSKVGQGQEVRNRKTGKPVAQVAKQYVVTLPHEEVLGVSASSEGMFIATETGLQYVALAGC